MRRKTHMMQLVEARMGRPLEELVPELLNKYRYQFEVARELGISESLLSRWMAMLGIEVRREIVMANNHSGTGESAAG